VIKQTRFNGSIICIDAEAGIFGAYPNTLQKNDFSVRMIKELLARRQYRINKKNISLYYRQRDLKKTTWTAMYVTT